MTEQNWLTPEEIAKEQERVEKNTREGIERLRRWGPIILLGLLTGFLVWRFALWLMWPLIIGVVLLYFGRSPWGRAVWRWFLDAVFYRIFRREELPSQTLPFRPLGEFEPVDTIERDGFVPLPHIEWGSPPRDEKHSWYRVEYARIAQQIENAPDDAEGDGRHERRKLVFYHAELLEALKLYGDNPLLTPVAPPLAAFGPVGGSGSPRSGILAALVSGLRAWQLYALGALAAFGGWQFARAEVASSELSKAKSERIALWGQIRRMEQSAKQANLDNAQTVARAQQEAALSQKYLEDERARRALQNSNIRRIAREASIDAGVPVDIGLRILSEPTDTGPGPDAPNPAPADSGLQPGVSIDSGDSAGVRDAPAAGAASE